MQEGAWLTTHFGLVKNVCCLQAWITVHNEYLKSEYLSTIMHCILLREI